MENHFFNNLELLAITSKEPERCKVAASIGVTNPSRDKKIPPKTKQIDINKF